MDFVKHVDVFDSIPNTAVPVSEKEPDKRKTVRA